MATFYLFNNADFDGTYTMGPGESKTWSSARTVAGTISKVKIVFTNTDVLNPGVKVAGSNLDVKFALACENRYSIKY